MLRLVLDQSKERVIKGERITITKHGVPVTVLQPSDPGPAVNKKTVILELREFRKKHSLGDMSLKEMIEEGRR